MIERVNVPFFIARRYLFAHRGLNVITLLSAIAVTGIAVTTAALVCTLSVFNGFRGMVESLFTAIDPEYKVVVVEGKTVDEADAVVQAVLACDAVEAYSLVLEDNALLQKDGRQLVVSVKGVDEGFQSVTHIDSLLYGSGSYELDADVLQYGILGVGVAGALGVGAQFEGVLNVYSPRSGTQINMANPASSFRRDELYSPGVVFAVRQSKYDDNLVITSLPFARNLFSAPGRLSAIELKLRSGVGRGAVERLLDSRFALLDRYEQQADVFRIMNVEKMVSYAFLSLILLIVGFNIIGSLSMLIIDKRGDMDTLVAIGAAPRMVRRIFLCEGWLIAALGAVIGIVMGVTLCLLQQRYGFIQLGSSAGSFIIDAYPVVLQPWDVVLTFVTVLLVSAVAIIIPVRSMR